MPSEPSEASPQGSDAGRQSRSTAAAEFFDRLWSDADPWGFRESSYEQDKYEFQLALIEGRRYERALEVGCGDGCFTGLLAEIADAVLSVDVSRVAIELARQNVDRPSVEFRAIDILGFDPKREGPWDLIVFSETIYYVGWLHTFFDVAWLGHQLAGALAPNGRLLMANGYGVPGEHLMEPWLIRTYRDLIRNTGLDIEAEEVFRSVKNGIEIPTLVTLFRRPGPSSGSSTA